MHILIIEDEKKTASFVSRGLIEDNFTADAIGNGRDGLELAMSGGYDLIILDAMLPGMDGWEVLKRLRDKGEKTPVLLLTALDDFTDRAMGLQFDYLAKPFPLARVHTILDRGPVRTPAMLRTGDLEIDFLAHSVMRAGKRIDLTPKEFDILSFLAKRSGEVLSRAQIAERIWDTDINSETNAVDVHMHRLRSKVDKPSEKALIHTVRGTGYVLELR